MSAGSSRDAWMISVVEKAVYSVKKAGTKMKVDVFLVVQPSLVV